MYRDAAPVQALPLAHRLDGGVAPTGGQAFRNMPTTGACPDTREAVVSIVARASGMSQVHSRALIAESRPPEVPAMLQLLPYDKRLDGPYAHVGGFGSQCCILTRHHNCPSMDLFSFWLSRGTPPARQASDKHQRWLAGGRSADAVGSCSANGRPRPPSVEVLDATLLPDAAGRGDTDPAGGDDGPGGGCSARTPNAWLTDTS